MSLIDEATEEFVIMDSVSQDDGYGGITRTWKEGATINAAVAYDTSTNMLIAQSQGVTSSYTLTTTKNIVLKFHDVLKRKSDDKIFRVTTNGSDKFTPNSASLNMRQVRMEEWKLE